MKPNVRRTAEMLSLNAELDAIARRLDEARRVCDDGYPNLALNELAVALRSVGTAMVAAALADAEYERNGRWVS